MSPRTLAIVIVLLVVTAGCWSLTRRSALSSSELGTAGQVLAPALERMEGLTGLTVAQGKGSTTITLKDGLWRADDSLGGFPVDPARVTNLLRTTARFTTEQPRTTSPSRHAALSLQWPDPKAAARRLTVYAGDDIAADLILGKPQGSPQPSTYVRHAQADATYLCRGDVSRATNVASWIPGAAARIGLDEVAWVAYDGVRVDPKAPALPEAPEGGESSEGGDSSEDGQSSEASEPAWSATLTDDARAYRWTDEERTQAENILPTWMSTLSVETVQPWVELPPEVLDDMNITYGLKTGGTLEVTVYRDDDDYRWVRLLAVGVEPADATSDLDAAASAHARTGAYGLRVSAIQLYALDQLHDEPDPDEDEADDQTSSETDPLQASDELDVQRLITE